MVWCGVERCGRRWCGVRGGVPWCGGFDMICCWFPGIVGPTVVFVNGCLIFRHSVEYVSWTIIRGHVIGKDILGDISNHNLDKIKLVHLSHTSPNSSENETKNVFADNCEFKLNRNAESQSRIPRRGCLPLSLHIFFTTQ